MLVMFPWLLMMMMVLMIIMLIIHIIIAWGWFHKGPLSENGYGEEFEIV